MSVEEIIKDRNISEVLHFTTNRGLTGILNSGFIKSRKLLSEDKGLEHILKNNANFRRDHQWVDYVNLSLSRINHEFFKISSEKWHLDEDLYWCIISFHPEILTHEGVVFTTTNNIYSGVLRGKGKQGLERLFAKRIKQYNNKYVIRSEDLSDKFPTCIQAEVLYPKQIKKEHIQCVYVENNETVDEANALKAIYDDTFEVEFNRSKFSG